MTSSSSSTFLARPPRSGRRGATSPALRDERRLLFCGVLLGLAQLAGLVFIVCFFANGHPPMEATPVEAAVGFRDAASSVGMGTLLAVLPLPFALLFLAGLGSLLRRSGGGPLVGVVSSAGLLSFALPVVGSLVSSIAPAIGAADTSPAAGAVVKAIDGVMPLSLAVSGFPRAVMLVAVIVLLARVGLLGRPSIWTGYAIAALSLAGTATFVLQALFPLAALSALLFVAWLTVLAARLPSRTARLGLLDATGAPVG